MKFTNALFLLGIGLATMVVSGQTKKQFINPDGTKPAGYTQVVTTGPGKTVYLSGQVPLDSLGQISPDFKQQAIQVYENIRKALATAGATFSDVVKMQIYVVDYTPEKLETIRKVRLGYLDSAFPPASTLVGIAALYRPDVKIEIDVIAVVN